MSPSRDLRTCETVKHWIVNVDAQYQLSDQEWQERLAVLSEFCDHEGKDPDAIIAEAHGSRGEKIDYMRRLRRWVSGQVADERQAHDRQNIIRSFFINNGLRVATRPYPDMYRREARE